MNFTEEIVLENERVRLSPLKKEHLDLLLPFSLNEPELWTYSLQPANGEENLKKYMDFALEQRAKGDSYPFIVFDKLKNEYAGSTRFYDFNRLHKTSQLGFTWYGNDFQRTGLNKNCKFLLLSYAFEHLKLARVEFRADANNERSIKAMKSIGCVEEGILRSNCMGISGRRDSIVLSILNQEWENSVKYKLQSQLDYKF